MVSVITDIVIENSVRWRPSTGDYCTALLVGFIPLFIALIIAIFGCKHYPYKRKEENQKTEDEGSANRLGDENSFEANRGESP